MPRNKTIAIIFAAAILVFAIIFSLTEYREVSVNEWEERYNYSDEQPQGLYIFKELVTRYFKNVPITQDGYPLDSINVNGLYIQFAADYLEDEVVDTLISIVKSGNDVLIIGDYFNHRIADTVSQYFDDIVVKDSVLNFNFTDKETASDTNFFYQFHDENFSPNQEKEFFLMQGLDWESDQEFVKVATPDSLILMTSFDFGEGRLFYHVKKDLFYNYSYRQSRMFDYTQKIFSHFEPSHVYLLDPLTIYGSENSQDRNPLDFIQSQPALRAAYYLLILGTLLFVFFGGKRKQKIIPVLEKNKNTSLEYIDTVSQLFYQQERHEKLVRHMRNIFHHKMQKKYFVSPDDPEYVSVLAKKSKISETEIQYVMDRFRNLDDNFRFTSDQLVSLNSRIENIYNKIEAN